MKKIALVLAALFAISFQSEAQVKAGIKAGLSSENLNLESVAANGVNLALKDANYGYHLGLFVRAHLGRNLFLQPEVLFNSNTVDFEVTDFKDGLANTVLSESYQKLDIPVLAGLKLGPLRVNGGPVGHVHIASRTELDQIGGYEQRFNDFNLGFQVGGGLDIWRLVLDLRYEGNFNNFGEHMTIGGQQVRFDQSPSRVIMSVGWKF